MKTYQAFAVGLAMLAATTAYSQDSGSPAKAGLNSTELERYKHMDFDKIERSYLKCLESDNEGVVESAIGMVTYIRVNFPNRKMAEIRAKLTELASSGLSYAVRGKAFIAAQVFADPTAYRKIVESIRGDDNWPFDDLAAKFRP